MLFLHLLNLVCFLFVSTHEIMFEQGKVCLRFIEGNFLSKLFIQAETKTFCVSCSMPIYIITLVRDIVQAIWGVFLAWCWNIICHSSYCCFRIVLNACKICFSHCCVTGSLWKQLKLRNWQIERNVLQQCHLFR